jgi:stage II sporulation protein E
VFYSACWDRDFEQTYALMQKLYAKYNRTGKLTEKDLGQAFLKQCIHPGNVIGAARDTFREYDINRKWENKILESRAVLKEQMLGISNVIDSLSKEVRADFDVRSDTERDIRRLMDEEGIAVREVVAQVTGRNLYVSVAVRSKEAPDQLEPRIRKAVSAACGTRMSRIREMDRIGGAGYVFTYEYARMIGMVTGIAATAKEGAKVSGDSYTVKTLRDGRYMMMISDGMGSGEKAAKESSAVVSLVEDFYGAGFDDETIINSVNKLMILGNSEEMFSTVDLAMIDMKTGNAQFTKLGAPHSYIIREGTAKRIAAGALPFGILEEMKPQQTCVELKVGDVIVMFSDGVADAENGSDGLYAEMLRLSKGRSVQEMAEQLLTMAVAARNGAKDDMTVIAARVIRG